MYLYKLIWKPPSTSELTPYQLSSGLTHLGSEASKWLGIIHLIGLRHVLIIFGLEIGDLSIANLFKIVHSLLR